ncbi:MAG: primosomal protein [Austwickia sp.]|nr:primosomal protein [Austwickia sp.]MCO5308138.1 primosomal protein [Austwickia sp.]
MSADPRASLATFVSALERHLEAASSRRGENDPAVVAAYQDLAEAFDAYDDALMEAFGEVTPLEIYSGDDEDDDIDDDFDDDIDEDDDDDDEDDDDDDEDDDIDFDDDDDEADGAATPTL